MDGDRTGVLFEDLLQLIYRWSRRIDSVIGRLEDIGLAGVALTLDAGDDPVTGADDVTALFRVDPAVVVHPNATVLTEATPWDAGVTEVADDSTFTNYLWALAIRIAKHLDRVILRMVAVLEPLRRLNYNGFLPILCHVLSRYRRRRWRSGVLRTVYEGKRFGS